MLDATVEAVIIPASSTLEFNDRAGKNTFVRQLQGRFLVPSKWIHEGTFDEVHYCFAGVLVTRIGSTANRETLICLTDNQFSQNFQPCAAKSGDLFSYHQLDFNFHFPTSEAGSPLWGHSELDDLPPTGSFSGNTYVAQQTALSDRQSVPGSCEVSYLVQAQFCRGQTVIRELSVPVTVSIDEQLKLKTPPLSDLAGLPKFNMRSIWKSPPTLTLDLFNAEDMPIRQVLGTPHKSMNMPFTVKVQHLDSGADSLQSLRCTVEARWCRKTSFATTKLSKDIPASYRVDLVFRSTRQKRVVYLPPLWPTEAPNDTDPDLTYTATGDLILFMPDHFARPTIQRSLLTRTYSLELSFCFEADQALPRYIIGHTVPVTVQAAKSDAAAAVAQALALSWNDLDTVEGDVTPPPSYAASNAEQSPVARGFPNHTGLVAAS